MYVRKMETLINKFMMNNLKYILSISFLLMVNAMAISAQPMHKAIIEEDMEKLQKKLKRNAKKANTRSDKAGNFPLHLATKLNKVEYAEVLLKHGANVNLQNKVGATPLIIAVQNDNLELCKMLAVRRPTKGLKDRYGKTILDYIKSREVGWTVGTEKFLVSYVKEVHDLERYQRLFPDSPHLPVLANSLLHQQSDFRKLQHLGKLGKLERPDVLRKAASLVRSFEDWMDYANIFGTGTFSDFAILSIKDLLSSQEIEKVISLSPEIEIRTKQELGKVFLKQVRSLEDAIDALKLFPGLKMDIAAQAQTFVDYLQQVRLFERYFRNSGHEEEIVQRLLRNLAHKNSRNRADLLGLMKIYPNSSSMPDIKRMYNRA